MYRSPAGPPPTPGSPLPARRILEPSSTPAGILTFRRSVSSVVPAPLHFGQVRENTCPRPWQREQLRPNAIGPSPTRTCPVPPQSAHGVAPCPPSPLHSEQVTRRR